MHLDLGVETSRLEPNPSGRRSESPFSRRNISTPRKECCGIAHGDYSNSKRFTRRRYSGWSKRLGRFAKKDGQCIAGGRTAALQFGHGHLDMVQQGLGTELVEFAGRTGVHETFDLAQAFALALADVGGYS